MTERAFARGLSSRPAAEVRREVSLLFSGMMDETDSQSPSSSLKSQVQRESVTTSAYSNYVEPEVPIDYEAFLTEHRDQLLADPEKHLLLFPDEDVEVFTVQRAYRTVDVPVPSPAKRSTDPLVCECVQGFMADWHSLRRRHGGFYGSDTHPEHGCRRSDNYLKGLPLHEYEVDMDKQEVLDREERTSKMSMQSTASSTGNDEFDSTESDELLDDLMPPVYDQEQMDITNQNARQRDRYTKLFGLCSLPSRDSVLETRTPAPLPQEQHGLRVLVKVMDLRLEAMFEPIFAELALYDVKERKKISESFHMDMNSSEMYHMLDDHSRERSMASLSRNAIFSITHPNPEVFLVLRLEKVLQKGDITEAAEPYQREMDRKSLDKAKSAAKQFCQQLGQYRMPLAWTAINVIDIISGNKAAGQDPSAPPTDKGQLERSQSVSSASTGEKGADRRSTTLDSSMSSSLLKKNPSFVGGAGLPAQSAAEGAKDEGGIGTSTTLNNSFRPVTLTVQAFFKQESDKLADDDLYRYLGEMKKGVILSRKLKSIPATLKLDISPPYASLPCCLTSNLWQVEPYTDMNRRPTREIEEFPSRPVYSPNIVYKNILYIYPQSLDFRNSKGRNIGIKIQFMAGEDPSNDALQVIYGRSSGPKYVREAWATVLYHNRNPEYYNEIKVELPAQLTNKHHILFTFYHISCMKPRPHEPGFQEPQFLGCTWIPLLEDGELKTSSYNLCVSAEKPPPAYSQLKTDVALPNLKWMENHKPLFKVATYAVSSIHPQDTALCKYFKSFLQYQFEAGTEPEEKELAIRIMGLQSAAPEPLVRFLYPILNGLFSLFVRHSHSEEAAHVQQSGFATLAQIAKRIQTQLDLPFDKHGHNILLASYLQHVFHAPIGAPPQGYKDKRATLSAYGTSTPEEENVRRTTSLRLSTDKIHHTSNPNLYRLEGEEDRESPRSMMRSHESTSRSRKLLHEEVALMWLVSQSSKVQEESMSVAWFFFGAMIKSMAQHLHRTGNLTSLRTNLFPSKFLHDLEYLINTITIEIAEKHIKNVAYARSLNTSLAFFLMDAYSLMDRGFVCHLIRSYIKKLALAPADYNLTEFKLDLFRIVCSHEHYVALNLPLLPSLDPPSPTSSTYENGIPNIESMAVLTPEFRQHHFLSGLVLSELARVLAGRTAKLREQAVELVRDLMASHDADPRYQSRRSRERIAMLYMPVLSIVMDNLPNLYHGGDGWDDWSTSTFERTTEVRRSVIIKDDEDTPAAVNKSNEPVPTAPTNLQQMGPGSTRNLLLCFLWVLRNIDPGHLCHWWTTLPISRLSTLLNVLDLCAACFEYKGKQAIASQTNLGTSIIQTSKSSTVRNQLAGMILGTTGGSAKERLLQRHRMMSSGSHIGPGTGAQTSSMERWGKTVWASSVSESTDKQNVNFEIDALIEGCLAGEAALVTLDTLETLIQTVQVVDSTRATLPRALEVLLHLLACNESVTVMEHLFATQRSIVVKFPDLLFEEETEQCAELCVRLLKHCSSAHPKIRTLACASLYLLMRHNYVRGTTFARVKVQVTVALSSIVAGDLKFDEYHLRRSLRTLVTYADSDSLTEVEGTDFPDQVRDLAANLHRILLDTVKMQEAHEDPAVLMDLMYRISKGYQNSPDLRLTWLQHMAGKHNGRQNFPEAAMCLVHAAALVAEYLYLLESKSYLPVGCVTFEKISPNVLEESAISEDDLSPEEEGMCTNRLFSEGGMIGLLEQAAELFREARLYEAVYEVYKIIIPIHTAKRQFKELEKLHVKLVDCFQNIVAKGDKRGFGTYYRVGFYGAIFGEDIDKQEFIYREQGLTRLAEFSLKLEKSYFDKYGSDHIVMIKDSNKVQTDQLDPNKGYIQITYLEPYFDEYELGLPERSTQFDRSFNIRRFVYRTPFTVSGKAHGNISDQYMRKTILTSEDHFPYVRTRTKVRESKEIILSPVEVAIEDMRDKINKLKDVLTNTQDTRLLQLQLQGGIATSVNQGPSAIAHAFLGDVPPSQRNQFHHRLRMCFREFVKLCGDALSINKALIQEEQLEYQREMERKYHDFQKMLAPLISSGQKAQPRRSRETTYLRKIATTRASRVFTTD